MSFRLVRNLSFAAIKKDSRLPKAFVIFIHRFNSIGYPETSCTSCQRKPFVSFVVKVALFGIYYENYKGTMLDSIQLKTEHHEEHEEHEE